MPSIPKERDMGWFYYSNPKPSPPVDPKTIPPPSQIDCLTSIQHGPEEPPRLMLKSTDTKYIQLAKMGGRQDLLEFKENRVNSGPPKPYRRNDWYYLEDNLLEDKQAEEKNPKKEPYQFGLPDYMIHESFNPDKVDKDKNSNACPYAMSDQTVVAEEKIPEKIKQGYGIRCQHPVDRKHFPPMDNSAFKSKTRNHRKMSIENEEAVMNRLLSNDYEKDWQQRLERWQEKRNKASDALANPLPTHNSKQKLSTEYERTIGTPTRKNDFRNCSSRQRQHTTCETTAKNGESTPENNELFKLNKFKDIAGKVNSHRNAPTSPSPTGPDLGDAVENPTHNFQREDVTCIA